MRRPWASPRPRYARSILHALRQDGVWLLRARRERTIVGPADPRSGFASGRSRAQSGHEHGMPFGCPGDFDDLGTDSLLMPGSGISRLLLRGSTLKKPGRACNGSSQLRVQKSAGIPPASVKSAGLRERGKASPPGRDSPLTANAPPTCSSLTLLHISSLPGRLRRRRGRLRPPSG